MTLNVHVSSLEVPDGTLLYVNVVGSSAVYPFTSNVIAVAAGSGSCTEQIFVYPGTTLTGVIITDVSGIIVFAGNESTRLQNESRGRSTAAFVSVFELHSCGFALVSL